MHKKEKAVLYQRAVLKLQGIVCWSNFHMEDDAVNPFTKYSLPGFCPCASVFITM